MLKESGESSHTCVRSPCEPTLEMRFILIFVLFSSHSADPPRPFFPPVTFQHGRVQSAGLWPSHYAELWASGRSSAFAGRTRLFAQTVLHGLAAAPGLQQVSRPARIITIVWTNPLTPCSSACFYSRLLFVLKRPYALFAFQSGTVTPL